MDQLLDFPLIPNALADEELAYELKIRNAIPSGTQRVKILELNKIRASEKTPPMDYINDPEDFSNSIEALTALQGELKRVLAKEDEHEERLVKSRIRHYQDRAYRCLGEDEEKDAILYGIVRNMRRIIRLSQDETVSSHNKSNGSHNNSIAVPAAGRGRGRKSLSQEEIEDVFKRFDVRTDRDVKLKSSHKPITSRDAIGGNGEML